MAFDAGQPVRLHIGCGKRYIPGFLHVDILPAQHIDVVADVRNLDFAESGSVDLVYACHLLEHFGRMEYRAVLTEWLRVLKPGGILRLSVPDFAACAALYYEQGLVDGLSGLMGLISGGQRDEFDYHKMIFDEPVPDEGAQIAGLPRGAPLGLAADRSRDRGRLLPGLYPAFSQGQRPPHEPQSGRHQVSGAYGG